MDSASVKRYILSLVWNIYLLVIKLFADEWSDMLNELWKTGYNQLNRPAFQTKSVLYVNPVIGEGKTSEVVLYIAIHSHPSFLIKIRVSQKYTSFELSFCTACSLEFVHLFSIGKSFRHCKIWQKSHVSVIFIFVSILEGQRSIGVER